MLFVLLAQKVGSQEEGRATASEKVRLRVL